MDSTALGRIYFCGWEVLGGLRRKVIILDEINARAEYSHSRREVLDVLGRGSDLVLSEDAYSRAVAVDKQADCRIYESSGVKNILVWDH